MSDQEKRSNRPAFDKADNPTIRSDSYVELGATVPFDQACDMMREMGRERLEEAVEMSERRHGQREFWGMMQGSAGLDRADREEELIRAAKAILADPGVFEHIARLRDEIASLEGQLVEASEF